MNLINKPKMAELVGEVDVRDIVKLAVEASPGLRDYRLPLDGMVRAFVWAKCCRIRDPHHMAYLLKENLPMRKDLGLIAYYRGEGLRLWPIRPSGKTLEKFEEKLPEKASKLIEDLANQIREVKLDG